MNRDGTSTYATRCLAVWEGERPLGDPAAGRTFGALYRHFVRDGESLPHDRSPCEPATERIAAYQAALLARWPNPSGEPDDHPVWDDGLIDDAVGPLLYFGVQWNLAEDVMPFAARVAASMGLVCFDVSNRRLLS